MELILLCCINEADYIGYAGGRFILLSHFLCEIFLSVVPLSLYNNL